MTDDQNSRPKNVKDYTDNVEIEFGVDPWALLYGWLICVQNNSISKKNINREIFRGKSATRVIYSLPNGL